MNKSKNHIYNNCHKTKVTKVYICHNLQKHIKVFFKCMYTDLVELITFIEFKKE